MTCLTKSARNASMPVLNLYPQSLMSFWCFPCFSTLCKKTPGLAIWRNELSVPSQFHCPSKAQCEREPCRDIGTSWLNSSWPDRRECPHLMSVPRSTHLAQPPSRLRLMSNNSPPLRFYGRLLHSIEITDTYIFTLSFLVILSGVPRHPYTLNCDNCNFHETDLPSSSLLSFPNPSVTTEASTDGSWLPDFSSFLSFSFLCAFSFLFAPTMH